MTDVSQIEVPRWVKKPGESKRVETHADLKAALADGWVLRLETTPALAPDAAVAVSAEDAEDTPTARKPGRPRQDSAKKK